jgi:hypothetical protein
MRCSTSPLFQKFAARAVTPQTSPQKLKNRQIKIEWLQAQANWTHAVTLTMHRPKNGHGVSNYEVARRCGLFLRRINRRIYKHGTKRKGFRISSVAFLGDGSYGDHPHVHWALQKPSDMTHEAFEQILNVMASTTKGLGKEFDIKPYRDEGWLGYMVDHGLVGLMDQLTFTAVCPKH